MTNQLLRALVDGLRRVASAPAVLGGVYALTLLAAVPLSLIVRDAIAADLGASVVADGMADGVNWPWWEEFLARSTGLERTFRPQVIGFAAVLSNLSALADNTGIPEGLAWLVAGYLVVWTFLIGGILDRFARNHRLGSTGFFAASGTYFFRFLRLAVLAGLTYWVLFGLLHQWLLDDLYRYATRNLTTERSTFAIRLGLYGLFGGLLVLTNLVFDYAKIRAVVEDRHSMLGALVAAVRFVRRRPAATIGLYLLNGVLVLVVLMAYALAAPGGATGSIWLLLIVGQGYVLARLTVKLLFYASQTAYFQGELAHAAYVASPPAVWPESPAAEAIANTPT